MVDSVVSRTIDFLSTPSVVGYEQCFMSLLEREFQVLGLTVFRHERYLAIAGNDPQAAIMCAHLDRHGLISIGHDEYVYAAQYIKEIKYGENNRLARKQLENIAKRFEGEKIYAYGPESCERLGDGVIEVCNPCMLNGDALFYVQGMKPMAMGVPLAYARTARFEDGILKGQIDNAISLGVVYELFKAGFQGTAILTTEEEIGKSWLHIKAYLEMMNYVSQSILVLDTSPYADEKVIHDGDIIFRSRDMSAKFDTDLVESLKARARDLGYPYQVKDEVMLAQGKAIDELGSTELGRLVQHAQERWNGATVQIPTLMYHTSNETTTAHAIEHYFLFLKDILIDNGMDLLRVEREDG